MSGKGVTSGSLQPETQIDRTEESVSDHFPAFESLLQLEGRL